MNRAGHRPPPEQITAFIERWEHSGAAERANYTSFLCELCALLDLPRPDPTSPNNARNTYVFERAITRKNPDGTTSTGFIDIYRRGSFVWECKQGHASGDADDAIAPVPDHPWIDSADGAAVRIAMTVAAPGKAEGILEKVIAEFKQSAPVLLSRKTKHQDSALGNVPKLTATFVAIEMAGILPPVTSLPSKPANTGSLHSSIKAFFLTTCWSRLQVTTHSISEYYRLMFMSYGL